MGEQDQNDNVLNQVVKSVVSEDEVNSYTIDLSLKGQKYNVSISLKNNEATLPSGEFTVAADLGAARNCLLTLSDEKGEKSVTHGKVNIASENGIYTINIDLVIGASAKYSLIYQGEIVLDSEVVPYKDITLTEVTSAVATPMDNGSFQLDLSLKSEGYTASLSINSPYSSLPDGQYVAASNLEAFGNCRLSINDGQKTQDINHGNVTIESKNGKYIVSIDAIVSTSEKYLMSFEGNIDFEIDFEPSPYTIITKESNITTWEANSWGSYSEVVIDGVSKYTLLVINSQDNTIASFELVSEPGKTLSELTGEYTVGSDNEPGILFKGANSWGSISGSYFYDDQNAQSLITKGSLTIRCMKDKEGKEYYSFTGNEITSKNTSLNIKYVAVEPFQGTVIRNKVISSKKMNKSMKYSLYLPAGYEEGDSYPILYLLHGYGDENNAWLDKGNLMMTARSYEKNGGNPMIVVCPDGLTDFYQGRWENYMYEELMPEIENNYKFNGKRAVAGLSMGGYGSIYYWSKYSDMYCYAYAMSPAVNVSGTAQILVGKDKSSLPGLTIETGIQDQTTSLTSITEFHDYLVSEDIKHEFITRDGSHDWTFWQVCLPKALDKCGEACK